MKKNNFQFSTFNFQLKVIAAGIYILLAFTSQAQNIDSLYAVFSTSRGHTRIGSANEIMKYVYENDYFDPLITLKTDDDEAFILATVYDAMGSYFSYEKENFVKSTDFYRLSLVNYEKVGDAGAANLINGNIGSNYARTGDYENAVAYMMKCYEWEKSMGDSEGLGSTLNNLGVVYSQWDKPDMAIRFFEEAEMVERSLNRPMNYANRLSQLAREYSKIDNVSNALQLIKEALQYDEKIESKSLKESRIATHQTIMGDIYAESDSLANAADYYQKALSYFEKNEQHYYVATTLLQLGRLQVKAKRYSEAIVLFQRCEKIAEDNLYLRIQLDISILLSETYSRLEPNTMSYIYLKKYTELNDSIFNEASRQQISNFQVQYETAEKQLEIERQQSEIARQKTRQFIYIGGLIAAGLLLSLLAYIIVLRNRRNRLLAETNATKDKFFSIISHDLKNPVVLQRDSLQMITDYGDKMDADTLSEYHRKTLKLANGLFDLLTNLLDWAKIQTGRTVYNPCPFNLVAVLQPDIGLVKSMAERKAIDCEVQMPSEAVITGDQKMITTVVRNLLTNAVKFTATGGNVSLEITECNGKYTVAVSDTGTGMTQEQQQNLFRIDRQQTREGTAGEQSSGLGLIVCRDMLQKHGSTLKVESEEGKGSRFWFEM